MKLPGRLEIDFFLIPRSLFHLLPAVSECVGSFLDLLSRLQAFPGKTCSKSGSSFKNAGHVFLHEFLHMSYLALEQ